MKQKKKKASPKKTKTSTSAKPTKDFVAIIEGRFRHYVGVLMEDTNSKFQQIQESFATLATKEALQRVENEVKEIKSEQLIVKQVLTGHSSKLNEHSAILKDLSARQEEHSAILKEHSIKLDQKADKQDLDRIEKKMDAVLAGHEQRLTALENK